MKKFFCIILTMSMLAAPMTAFAGVVTTQQANKETTTPVADGLLAESATYDTSVFEGTPAYILQDQLSSGTSSIDKLGVASGWDVSDAGGSIFGAENSKFQILDSEEDASVTMTKKLMAHKAGKITFETAFNMETKASSGFGYTLLGEDKIAVKIITENDTVCVQTPDGKLKPVYTYKVATIVPIRAIIDFDAKNYEIIVGGKYCGKFNFAESATQLDKIIMGTTDKDTPKVWVRYVHLYLNYTVNDNFMHSPEGMIPYGWTYEGGGNVSGVVYDGNQVYPDTYSLAVYDPTTIDKTKLYKTFETKTGKFAFENRFLMKDKSSDTYITLSDGKANAITIKTTNTDIVTGNGTVLKANYSTDMWYTLKVVADVPAKKADIYLNYKKVLSDVPFENNVTGINTITYETPLRKIMKMRVDDVKVYDVLVPTDYVPTPQPVKPDGGLEVGMQMYSMWNEGNHYGWDWVTAYPDRIPYLGTYAEGKPEVADWVTKWQVEHGFTFRTEIFSRATANINKPVKLPTRYHAMFDGYFNSEYKDMIKFSVLYSGISASTLGGMDDFKNNIVPFFIENFFTQPNYLLKDNKPVLFMYGASNFVNVLGGIDRAQEAILYLDAECKKVGFDGVIFIPDGVNGSFINYAPDFAQNYVYSYGWQYDARSTQTQLAKNDLFFASGANVVGSVTMGWGRNPWGENNLGEIFSTPQMTKDIILGIKDRFSKLQNPTNMIMLTCWDEYGEGHFFAPTRLYGFEYLNAVRDAVTSQGPKQTEDLPTAKALARMNSLYTGSRRALKIVKETEAPVYYNETVDHSKLQVLAEWDFEKMTDLGGWKVLKDVTNVRLENGALCGEATAKDPGIWIEGLNIKASDVQMVKVITQTEGAGQGQLFFQTSVDTEMGTNGKRFDVEQDDETVFKEYDGYPYDRKKLQGNITAIRWDPKNNAYPAYKDFKVKKIQILGYPTEEYKAVEPIKVIFNGTEVPITRPPFTKDGVLYFAPRRPLYEMKIENVFDYANGTYTINTGDKVAVLTNGSNIMKVNGQDVDLGAPAYYEDGNFFVPVRKTLEPLGFTVVWNGDANALELTRFDTSDTYPYLDKPDETKPFSWMFDTRTTEGWSVGMYIGQLKTKKGSLIVEPVGDDPFIYSSNINMNADEYKYMRIRLRNDTNYTLGYMLFTLANDSSWGNGKRIDVPLSANDKEIQEYIIPLESCEKWGGVVTRLRYNVVKPRTGMAIEGKVYIDSIEFLKELPQ